MLSVPPEVTYKKRRVKAVKQVMSCTAAGAVLGPNVHVRCHRSWVRHEKVCTPFSRPPPPSSSRQGRCPGEAGCSMQNLHKPGNRWKNLHVLQIFTKAEAQFEIKNTRGNHKRKWWGRNVFTAANTKEVKPFTTTLLEVYNKETRYQP